MKGPRLAVMLFAAALAMAISGGAVSMPVALAAKPKGLVLSSFKLNGSHGYEIEAISIAEGSAASYTAVVATREGLKASYETAGEPGLGIHAALGSVGSVDVGFHRHKRAVDRLSKGCRMVTETGVFRGGFSFEGEGGYSRARASAVRGEVVRLPNGFCSFDDPRATGRLPGFLRTTTLLARSRTANGSIDLEAWSWKIDPHPIVNATVREKVGELKITRSASAHASQDALTIGPGKPPRSASLKPPAPFSGSAHFEDPPDGPPSWIGSLSVSLPGVPAPIALTGPEFHARICLDEDPFGGCKVDLAPGKGRPEPEL